MESQVDNVETSLCSSIAFNSAPISKVIEFLPPGIPRILINRTVVHPSTRSVDSTEGETDPRDNYVFDAYLLGFCDDVTRCLAKKLFQDDAPPTPADKKRRNGGGKPLGRLLTKVLKGEDSEYDAEDWESLTVPPERVLLFPGAQASHSDSTEELTYREIAHCDGCSKRIRGTIKKCIACFDYDLCQNCFPHLSKLHYDGTHKFSAEPAMP